MPDRFPIDYLACPEIDLKLKAHFDVQSEGELLDALHCDFYYLSFRDISQNESFMPFYWGPRLEITENERICPFGIRYKRYARNSKFAVDDAIQGPLENAETVSDIMNHSWPHTEWFNFEGIHAEYELNRDRVIIGGMWTGILGDSFRMFGFERFLTMMALKPELIRTLVNRMTEFYLELNEAVFSSLKGKIDIWFFGNDFATQEGLLFSIGMFEDFFFENIKQLVNLAKSYEIKVMMHSCGAISELIPHFIEAGIDIIDPVQVSASGMDPQSLHKNFGKDVVFHGGIDTQQVLPDKNPDEVYTHACEIMGALGKTGGYIFAPSQILQADIHIEKIIAMYRAAHSYQPIRSIVRDAV
jgi:uroporphyrinogen decarboxylase